MPLRFSPWRALRSRRLAVVLIVGLGAYAAIATSIPRDRPVGGVLGALGFDAPFSHPVFLAPLALLALSTALCSWERTRFALRAARSRGTVSQAAVARLEANPPIPVGSSGSPLKDAEERLRSIGLSTRRGPRVLEGHAGAFGVWGSPVFHWALTALMVVLALGRLTRAEGQIGIPVGGERADVAESYGLRDEGPWHTEDATVAFRVVELDPAHVDARGIEVGPAPVVQVLRDGEPVAEGRVYPNRPLRHGTRLIHATDGFGLSAWVSIETSAGEVVDEAQTISDFDTSRDTGTSEQSFAFGGGASEMRLSVSPLAQPRTVNGRRFLIQNLPEDPQVEVVRQDSRGAKQSQRLRPGESMDLGGGLRLKLERVTLYARIAVADDWSVPWMYALFAIAALGITLAVFAPYRYVRVLLAKDGSALHAEWRHARRDPLFEERVRRALTPAPDAIEQTDPPSAREA